MSATLSGWHQEISLTIDQELFVATFTEVAQHLVALQVDSVVHACLEELADKCTEGQFSADERTEYETDVQTLEFIAVLQPRLEAS